MSLPVDAPGAGECLAVAPVEADERCRHRIQRASGAVLYAGSRLAVQFTPALLIPICLRQAPPAEANRLLVALAAASLCSGLVSGWLEQVVYRFPLAQVGSGVRRAVWVECLILAPALGLLVYGGGDWLFRAPEEPAALALLLAELVVTDLLYRVGIAAIQIRGSDGTFVCTNLTRFLLEFTLGAGALLALGTAEAVLLGMAVARVIALAPVWRAGGWPGGEGGGGGRSGWVAYGLSMSAWFVLLQLMQSAPQFLSLSYQELEESTGFLGAFRLFTQTALLGPAVLLVYMHPKLLACYQNRGRGSFLDLWIEWLPGYAAVTSGFVVVLGMLFWRYAGALLTAAYAGPARAVLYTAPGIICWGLANYAQKVLEVEGRAPAMALGLGASVAVFFGVFWASEARRGRVDFASLASVNLSLALSLYPALIVGQALGGDLAREARVRRHLYWLGGISAATVAFCSLWLLRELAA